MIGAVTPEASSLKNAGRISAGVCRSSDATSTGFLMRMVTTSRCTVLLAMLAWGSASAQQHRASRPMFAMHRAMAPMALRPPRPLLQRRGPAPVIRLPPPQLQSQRPAPVERRPPPGHELRSRPGAGSPGGGEHLAQWMDQHSNLSPAQQQQALESERGFRSLPPKVQQRYRDRLSKLNAMPPGQREHWLAHTEAMERLSLPQRAQVRGVMQQLGSLPQPQRQFVARSFRQLRRLPPDQRAAAMNSYQFQSQMNDAQRSTLNNLMRIEPMIPPD
jgi:hypothetical protein